MSNIDLEVRVKDKTAAALASIESRLKKIEGSTGQLSKGFGNVATAAKGFLAVVGARQILNFTKNVLDTVASFEQYRNQLRLITNGSEDLDRVFNRLVVAAQKNRTEFGATVDLFTKLRVTTEALGVSEERVINVTGKLSKALQLAGADGNTAASVIRQFGQAMASGEVRGDEFRSLVEGLGPALAIMARESGITVGQLRKMSQAGELTAEALFKMLENSTALENMFAKTNPTLDQLETATKDAFDRAIVSLAESTGLAGAYNQVLKELKITFDTIAGIENPFENMTLEILQNLEGVENLEKGMEELQNRYNKYLDMGPADIFFNTKEALGLLTGETHENAKAILNVISILEERLAITQEQIKADEELTQQLQAESEAVKKILDPLNQYTDLLDKYKKLDIRTDIQKARDEFNEAFGVWMKLKDAQGQLNTETESGQMAYEDLGKKIQLAGKAIEYYGNEIEKIELKNLEESLKVIEDLTVANDRLILQDVSTPLKKLERDYSDITKQIGNTKSAISKLNPEIELEAELLKELEAQLPQLVGSLDILQDKMDELAMMESPFYEFGQHIKEQGDMLKQLGRVSTQVYDRMANDLTNFVMTGKFDFADFSRFVIRELIKIAVQAALTFAIKTAAGAFGFSIPGLAEGGPVRRGNPYVVGEQGPELFIPQSSGRIVPNDQMTSSMVSADSGAEQVNINFNITATDASSFDELLVTRRATIIGIINEGLNRQGKRSLM